FELEWARDAASGHDALRQHRHDVCLVDYRLNGATGLELVRAAVAEGLPCPLILLTGQGDHAVDVEAMRAGVADFLVKGRIDAPMLERAIRYAIERKRAEAELRQLHSELELRVRDRTAALAEANERLRDEVAARSRLEDELRRRMDELAEEDRRKDLFLATLGHELRNPLAPITTALHLMQRRDPKDPDLCWARDVIDRQVRQLTRLVDDLLEVSRVSTGKIQLHREA